MSGNKRYSSSDEAMDTSDKTEANFNLQNLDIAGQEAGATEKTRPRQPTVEEQADEVIKEVERSKARMYEVKGREFNFLSNIPSTSIAQIDENYQMIDSLVDEGTK